MQGFKFTDKNGDIVLAGASSGGIICVPDGFTMHDAEAATPDELEKHRLQGEKKNKQQPTYDIAAQIAQLRSQLDDLEANVAKPKKP